MKLSQMNTDQLFDCLADIAAPVANIMQDNEVVGIFKDAATRQKDGKGMSVIELAGAVVSTLLPAMLKSHKDDTLAVIGALSGKTVAELRIQSGLQTLKDAKDVFDKDLIDFFGQSASTGKGE